jgi:3-hydroxyacyl-[acyl-carrier-protein] dehydratase
MKPPWLPHGPGFRLIDAIAEIEPGPALIAQVWLNPEWAIFREHFPGAPLLPAVYLMEMAAQAAGALWAGHAGFPPAEPLRLVEVRQFRVQLSARPGQSLRVRVRMEKAWERLALFNAMIERGPDKIAEGTFVMAQAIEGDTN